MSATSNIQSGQALRAIDTSAVGAEALNGTGGPGGAGGYLNTQKDVKDAPTDAKFGDILKTMQSKFGKKEEKPREIKKTLDKDDFLKIMMTQMKFQDPSNPFKPEQMAAEMAQFTSVEQLSNVNQNLQKLMKSNQPSERLAMTGLIGKTVTVDKDRFNHTENSREALSFELPRDAKNITVTLIHENGEMVLQKDLGSHKGGEVLFDWDGKQTNSLPAKPGNYMLRITAIDEQEKTIIVSGKSSAKVVGVNFEGTDPLFLIGDPKSPTKVTMKNIVKIDDSGPAVSPVQAIAAPAASPMSPAVAPPESGANFIKFDRGVGSQPLDAAQAPPEVQQALAAYDVARASPVVQAGSGSEKVSAKETKLAKEEKGFPNGLSAVPGED